MIPYDTSRPTPADVRKGITLTWLNHKGDVTATAALLVALVLCLVFGADPALAWVLITATVANLARTVVGEVLAARGYRDLNTYYDALASQGVSYYQPGDSPFSAGV